MALKLCPQAGKWIPSLTKKCQPARGLPIGGEMPELGEIKQDKWYSRYIWVACIVCGKQRWVHIVRGSPRSLRCSSCQSKRAIVARWREHLATNYAVIRINGQNKKKARLIMEGLLGRLLKDDEVVHHINGDKRDNSPTNLQLMTDWEHRSYHGKLRTKRNTSSRSRA